MSEDKLDRIIVLLEQIRDRILVKEEKVIEKSEIQETPKKAKGTKKIEFGKVYNFKKKDGTVLHCNTCDGLISWDDWDKDTHKWATHVDKDGHIIGDGSCPEWEAK